MKKLSMVVTFLFLASLLTGCGAVTISLGGTPSANNSQT
jgi:hypothetical protein